MTSRLTVIYLPVILLVFLFSMIGPLVPFAFVLGLFLNAILEDVYQWVNRYKLPEESEECHFYIGNNSMDRHGEIGDYYLHLNHKAFYRMTEKGWVLSDPPDLRVISRT